MRIITLNANGIRAAEKKGVFSWLKKQNADVVCIQETKAQEHQLTAEAFHPESYHCYYHDAVKKGYSGVALYCKKQPDEIIKGIGWEDVDVEGRFIEARFGTLSVISLYLHSGSASEERQAVKYKFLDRFLPYLRDLAKDGRDYVVCGDWNIAHTEKDIRNAKGNKNNSGFLPKERAWLDELFSDNQWFDAFRMLEQADHEYTWWSNRGQSWAKNVGWRIDYHVVSKAFEDKVQATDVYRGERFSDHAPLTVDYDYLF